MQFMAQALHISPSTFLKSLKKLCPSGTIGLAVSGGVDSMALATLCAASTTQNSGQYRFRAFVVDHGARSGSAEEAEKVAHILRERALDTSILKVQWAEGTTISELSNFETQARIHRFQALGKACRRFGIKYLCMAHHADDQAETIMWRLAQGHRGIGLAGMKVISNIPECYGLHGVYESGSFETSECAPEYSPEVVEDGRLRNSLPDIQPYVGKHLVHMAEDKPKAWTRRSRNKDMIQQIEKTLLMSCEEGGIKIVRPFLSESKSNLIATCRYHNTSWFEDHTNNDPSLTPRNAIRQLYGGLSLPRALGKPSLLAFSSKLRDSERRTLLAVENFAPRGMTATLDPCFGTLRLLCDPKAIREEVVERQGDKHAATTESSFDISAMRVMAHKLRVFVDAVSPMEGTRMPDLALARHFLNDTTATPGVVKYHIAGVQIERLGASSKKSATTTTSKVHMPPVTEWLFSRQPYGDASRADPPPYVLYPPPTTVSEVSSECDPPEKWQLYDGRYWIKLNNHTQHTLKLRPFHPDDLQRFAVGLNNPTVWRSLQAILKHRAPGTARWTLPAIVQVKSDNSEEVVLLPTLGVGVPNAAELVTCKLRYKKVRFVDAPR